MVNIVKSRKCGVTSAKVTANIKPKRNGSRKKRGNPEEQQTIAFVQHMRQFYPETFKMIHHTPNESKYAYKPDSGVKPGVPDFFLAIMRGEYGGLFIEFKAPGRENEKNGGLSDEQVIAMDDFKTAGYRCAVVYNWMDGITVVADYMKLGARPNPPLLRVPTPPDAPELPVYPGHQ